MSLASYLERAPKAELHLHLEGSVRPATLFRLAARNRVRLPVASERELGEWLRFTDFGHFIEVYLAVTSCLKDQEDYRLVVIELARELASQGVVHAEVTVTPATARGMGVRTDDLLRGLERGREEARREHGVALNWVFDIVRNLPDGERARAADFTLGAALDCRRDGVVALGLGGLERGFPARPLARWFERAKADGLGVVPHAGELAGPESVREALEVLAADRIGHGVRAAEDPALVAELARRGVPLEVCPTSNLALGVYPDLASHPLPLLVAAGVRVTLGSDDPALFETSIGREAGRLASDFGFDREAAERILLEGARASLLPPGERAALEKRLRDGMDALAAGALEEPGR